MIEAADFGGLYRFFYYGFLAPHLWAVSIQTPPAFTHSVLSFAFSTEAKAGAVKAVATAKVTNAKRSLFIVNSPLLA
jgi:hypothetical protein